MNFMKVFCVVATYNGSRYIRKCLSTLRIFDMPVTTVVVDNHYNDATQEIISGEYPDVVLIQLKKDIGFDKERYLKAQFGWPV
jgi:N-acetylglucosaminyl-diphospho-decaprenol L-rhamnosyltransferase